MAYSPAPAPTSQRPVKQGNGFGVTALILGIIAILGFWLPIINVSSIALGSFAIIFAVIAFIVSGNRDGAGRGTGATGLVLGLLAVLFSLGLNATLFQSDDETAEPECDTSVEECAGEAEEVSGLEQKVDDLQDKIDELLNSNDGGSEQQPEEGSAESEQPADTEESTAPAEEGAETTTE